MSFSAAPGGILAASQALQEPRRAYTPEQVAYFILLAYQTGKLHGVHIDLRDTGGAWRPDETPEQTRSRRIAARLAEYGPDTGYRGGPVPW